MSKGLLRKLLAKGRVIPITKETGQGTLIVGYQRKPGSRHAGEEFLIKKPILTRKAA